MSRLCALEWNCTFANHIRCVAQWCRLWHSFYAGEKRSLQYIYIFDALVRWQIDANRWMFYVETIEHTHSEMSESKIVLSAILGAGSRCLYNWYINDVRSIDCNECVATDTVNTAFAFRGASNYNMRSALLSTICSVFFPTIIDFSPSIKHLLVSIARS